jgi:2-dehydropantoate 2-reductase
LQTSRGGFRVGTLSGNHDVELGAIAGLLETVGEVRFTDNLRGARFSKLALNCAVSTLGTIGSRTLGRLLLSIHARRLALAILREAIEVARADGIRLEPVTKLDLQWLERPENAWTAGSQHALLVAIGLRYRRLRSSMLAAMERGRDPAVDFLNGELVDRGRRLGVPTPVNQAACRMVWEIAAGQRQAGGQALEELARMTGVSGPVRATV